MSTGTWSSCLAAFLARMDEHTRQVSRQNHHTTTPPPHHHTTHNTTPHHTTHTTHTTPHTTTTTRFKQVCIAFGISCCSNLNGWPAMAERGEAGGTGSARRRRKRRLRSFFRHEWMSVAVALAESTHHSAQHHKTARAGRGVRVELHGDDPEQLSSQQLDGKPLFHGWYFSRGWSHPNLSRCRGGSTTWSTLTSQGCSVASPTGISLWFGF